MKTHQISEEVDYSKVRLAPMKAMRAKCIDCCCEQVKEIRECPITGCSIWPYRMGHNPARIGHGNGSTNESALTKAREAKKRKENA